MSRANRLVSCECGSYPRLKVDDNGRYWFVECKACGRSSIHCRTDEEAVEQWNEPVHHCNAHGGEQ